LPRHHSRRGENRHLRGTRRIPTLPRPLRPGRRAARLAGPRVLPDAEPLPPGRRDPALAPLRRHAPPQRRLRASVQPPPQTLGPPLRRALRVLGRRRRRPPRKNDRVRPPEPGPGGPGPKSRGLAVV